MTKGKKYGNIKSMKHEQAYKPTSLQAEIEKSEIRLLTPLNSFDKMTPEAIDYILDILISEIENKIPQTIEDLLAIRNVGEAIFAKIKEQGGMLNFIKKEYTLFLDITGLV